MDAPAMSAAAERAPSDSRHPARAAGRAGAGAAASPRVRIFALVAVLAILGAALWLIDGQIDKAYVYDDVNFILGARAVADTGRPFGNQGYLLHLYHEREQWALWHPPLYLYALGLTVKLFGDGERAARGLSVLCMLIAAGFAFDLARRTVLLRGGSADRALVAGVLAVAVYALNPLAIQAAQVLDIDNTVLMVLLVSVVWLAVRLPGSWSVSIIVGLALLYALGLWAKLTTPLALAVALAFTRLFQPVGWRGALQALAVAALGWAIFTVTWLGISALAGFPIEYTLEVVHNEALESSLSSRDRLVSLQAFVYGVAPALLWIGPFFCLLFVSAGLPRLWSLLRGKGLDAADVLVVLGAAIYLAYIFKLAGNFPKYHAAMLPLWAAASGALVARLAGRPTLLQYTVVMLGGGVLWAWMYPRTEDLWAIVWEVTLNVELILIPLAIGLGVALLLAVAGRRNLLGALPVAFLVLTLVWSMALDVVQRDRKGSSTYFYGRIGQHEAAEALDRLLRPGEVYVASKEAAWYAREKHYVDQDSWQYVTWEVNGARWDYTYEGYPIRVLALEVGEQSLRWAYDGLLLRNGYQYAGEYGNFLIYVRQ
ncbi:MAG: glycosyltransferase family 39 protein [Chloroflexi bacterium]|nr:glycosyltransferase family 39 protein [Chloroflexota bacterium]